MTISLEPGEPSMCLPVTKVQNIMTISFQLAKAKLTIIAPAGILATSKISKTRRSSRIRCSSSAAGVSLQVNSTSAMIKLGLERQQSQAVEL
jgi:hypothetical protein